MKPSPKKVRPPEQRDEQNARERARCEQLEPMQIDDAVDSAPDTNGTWEELPHQRGTKQSTAPESPRTPRQNAAASPKKLTPSESRNRERDQRYVDQNKSFVMKLFDRSLDLSKYSDDTPLYPICRAWIANQPRNPNISNYRERRSPTPVQREVNGAAVLEALRKGEIQEIYAMPAPEPTNLPIIPPPEVLKVPEESTKTLDEFLKEAEDANTDNQEKPTTEELLEMNKKKWKKVKSNWMDHTRRYQERYQTIYDIIDELYLLGQRVPKDS